MCHIHNTLKYLIHSLGLAAIFTIGVLSVIGSGGGDTGYEGDGSTGSYVWISIRSPDDGTVVDTSSGYLSGWASCPECPPSESAFGGCPPISCPTSTSVIVSWINQTTGTSGSAYQSIIKSCSCLLSQCASSCIHQWSASVPIEFGPNTIAVTASNPDGSSDSDSTMISRLPPPPEDVVAIAGHNEITVSWSNAPEAISYNLYWSASKPISKDTANKIIGVTSPYTVTGLSDNITYYFIVTAVTGEYESYGSDIAWATAGWFTESVAETLDTTESRDASIAVDSEGNPHIHYSYDEFIEPSTRYFHNHYTKKVALSWISVFYDRTSSVNADIAIDSSDSVHLSYLDFPGLIHSVYISNAWVPEAVDSEAWCNSSLAIDSADKLHFTYRASGTNEDLRYANNISGIWESTTLDTFTNIGCILSGRRLSIAVDETGVAHIAYAGNDYPEYGLKYATNKGGYWSVETVDDGYIEQVSIAVDQNSDAHIVYADNISQLRYAKNISGSWSIELIESEGSPIHPSLVVDSGGRAHISYYNNGDSELRYATNPSGIWQLIPIDTVEFIFPDLVADTSISMDSFGKIHITYFNGGTLKYTSNK